MRTEDLKKIEESNEAFILCEDIGRLLGITPQCIREQAKKSPQHLGFPVVVVGNSIRIPRVPFLQFVKGKWKMPPTTANSREQTKNITSVL